MDRSSDKVEPVARVHGPAISGDVADLDLDLNLNLDLVLVGSTHAVKSILLVFCVGLLSCHLAP